MFRRREKFSSPICRARGGGRSVRTRCTWSKALSAYCSVGGVGGATITQYYYYGAITTQYDYGMQYISLMYCSLTHFQPPDTYYCDILPIVQYKMAGSVSGLRQTTLIYLRQSCAWQDRSERRPRAAPLGAWPQKNLKIQPSAMPSADTYVRTLLLVVMTNNW